MNHTNTDTGGAAIPLCRAKNMALRDYFASHASEEDIEAHRTKAWVDDSYIDGHWEYTNSREVAKYLYADALLKAREEK